jgi:HSP20 family molecular chaperone IbpA
MAERQQLQVQKKREQEKREETTIPARVFVPTADIYETKDALTVILEMPGVEKNNVNVGVQDGVLNVEGRLDLKKYQGKRGKSRGSYGERARAAMISGRYGMIGLPGTPSLEPR